MNNDKVSTQRVSATKKSFIRQHKLPLSIVNCNCHHNRPRLRPLQTTFASGPLQLPLLQLLLLPLLLPLIVTSCQPDPATELHELFDEHWAYTLQSNPLFATNQGDHRFNDRLPDSGLEALEKQHLQTKQFLEQLTEIPRERLSRDDQISYDIFELQLTNAIEAYRHNDHLLPLNGWWDYHATFADLANRVPLDHVEDYENYLQRLAGFPDYNEGYLERLEQGLEMRWVRPQAVFDNYTASIEAHIVDDVTESLLFEPFKEFPSGIDEQDRQRLKDQAIGILETDVIPEFRRLSTFLTEVYIPGASETIGITELAGGEEYYEYLVRLHTTLDISPEEVHQIGLGEVERIREEMMEIVEETGFGDDFDAFVDFLRTDPQFYAETPEELMHYTAYVLKKMDGQLPKLFKTLPRLPYGIRKIPDYLAPRTATAYYSRGAADGTRAGFYAVNTYDLASRPLYEVEALSLHEAVPGHHLQIALQQELDDLPEFRQTASFTAFGEGWALYAERLGLKAGFYEDPYSNFGRLSYEMWRALRLVVDTGMHAFGWTREEAIDYMSENSSLSLHNIRTEVDRYIFWPGQALGYKMGEIKIMQLRERAEDELGDAFDLRKFHDIVLLNGGVPLNVLEDNIELKIGQRNIEQSNNGTGEQWNRRTIEQANNRTGEQWNRRTIEQANNRTDEQ